MKRFSCSGFPSDVLQLSLSAAFYLAETVPDSCLVLQLQPWSAAESDSWGRAVMRKLDSHHKWDNRFKKQQLIVDVLKRWSYSLHNCYLLFKKLKWNVNCSDADLVGGWWKFFYLQRGAWQTKFENHCCGSSLIITRLFPRIHTNC